VEKKTIKIPLDELLLSLEDGYIEIKNLLKNETDEVDLAHVKGFCTTIEQILVAYGNISVDEIMKIKTKIIGNMSLRRKSDQISFLSNLDEPTYIRKNMSVKNSK
jgi:hypothetical protein